MNFSLKPARPLFFVFLIISALLFTCIAFALFKQLNYLVLMGANCLFFLISLFVFRLQYNAMFNKNPNVFIRKVMGSTMLKLLACVVAVIAYYFISGPNFNKPAVYISMIFYLIYLIVEVGVVMKLNKTKHA